MSAAGLMLITSGAFVEQELAAEFGHMPPCFLPVGMRRLFEYQIEQVGRCAPVFLTLPETYVMAEADRAQLGVLSVTILAVPEGLALGESIVFALNLIGGPDQPVRILHGDTLIAQAAPLPLDSIGVVNEGESYSWAEVELDGDRIVGMETVAAGGAGERTRPIACGVFAFAHSISLVRSITRARGSFIGGILDYGRTHPLRGVAVQGWHDFGHVQTYFRSRRFVSSARHFNTLRIDDHVVHKSSDDKAKMQAEAGWIAALPAPLRIYSARLIDAGVGADGRAYYETAYGHLPTLAELFVFGTLGSFSWAHILRSCEAFLAKCSAHRNGADADTLLRELAITKTTTRLEQFAAASGFDVGAVLHYDGQPLPSLLQIAEDAAQHVDFSTGRRAQVMHGDFCLSNILWDSRTRRIQVIDPRGYVQPGQPTTSGDVRYDLAKLAHSVLGRYDQIIAGHYELEARDRRFRIDLPQAPHHKWLETALGRLVVDGVCASGIEVRALVVCLFLSMLPLHADRPDRQQAFIANALRLYARLELESPQ